MALPHAREARAFYQAAKQRFEDARFLLENERTTGAIYLAGYSVECMLKALILSAVAKKQRAEVLQSFRGAKAHDYDWLQLKYLVSGGPQFPKSTVKALSLVSDWAVEIRYKAAKARIDEAKAFLDATEQIMTWADARL